MRFAAIADWVDDDTCAWTVVFMCQQLGVSEAGYYRWRRASPCRRAITDAELTALLRRLHHDLDGNPGVRRLRAELIVLGHNPSHKRVWRLMTAAGLRGRHPRAWKRTTTPADTPVPAPDLLARSFTAEAPNQIWCGDITYVKTWQGFAYLATVIDLHSRSLIGWAIADHMRTSLVTDALDLAIRTRHPTNPVIFHSDRGAQYTSREFADYCTRNTITRSTGRTGICWDNAPAESWFATYKKELIHTRPWPTITALIHETQTWITYYNTRRRHSTNHYLTPHEKDLGYTSIHDLPQHKNAA